MIEKHGDLSFDGPLPPGYGTYHQQPYSGLTIAPVEPYPTNFWPYQTGMSPSPAGMHHNIYRMSPNLPAAAAPLPPEGGGVIPGTSYGPEVAPIPDNYAPGTPFARKYSLAGLLDFLKPDADRQAARRASRADRRSMRYRDAPGSGGYRYRLYADGSIQILPGSPAMVGKRFTRAEDTRRWDSITAEVGTYAQARTAAALTALQAASQIASQFTVAPAAAAPPAAPEPLPAPAPAPGGFPGGTAGLLAAGALTVGLVAYLATRGQ